MNTNKMLICLSFLLASCATGTNVIEYTRLNKNTYPATTHVDVYLDGPLIGKLAYNGIDKAPDYRKIGEVHAKWTGDSKRSPVPLLTVSSMPISVVSGIEWPLPVAYLKKAMELGANGIIIKDAVEYKAETNASASPSSDRKVSIAENNYIVTTIYEADIVAIKYTEKACRPVAQDGKPKAKQ